MDNKKLKRIERKLHIIAYIKKYGRQFLSMFLIICMIFALSDFGILGQSMGKLANFAGAGIVRTIAATNQVDPKDGGSDSGNNHYWYDQKDEDNNWTTSKNLETNSTKGTVRYSSTTDIGSKDNPYIIVNGKELAYAATVVNDGTTTFKDKYIKIVGTKIGSENLIDLIGSGGYLYMSDDTVNFVNCSGTTISTAGWPAIGTSAAKSFQGHLYGEKETNTSDEVSVYNLSEYNTGNTYIGLVGYASGNASIENLHLKNTQLYTKSSASTETGALVAYYGASSTDSNTDTTLTINNCSVESCKSADGYTPADFIIRNDAGQANIDAGGAIGGFNKTKGTLSIDGISVSGNINPRKGNVYAGLVIGEITSSSATSTVKNIEISGTVTGGSMDSNAGIGGVIGRQGSANLITIDTVDMKDVVIQATESINSGKLGGVIGLANNGPFAINNVTGNIKLSTEATDKKYTMASAGGIIGYMNATKNQGTNKSSITNVGTADNSFEFQLRGAIYGAAGNGEATNGGVGGILGSFYGVTGELNISDVFIKDDVIYAGGSLSNNYYLGGVVGRVNAKSGILTLDNVDVTKCDFKRADESLDATTPAQNITIGGMIGGCNAVSSSSYVKNSSLNNATIATDGLCGGIIGASMTTEGTNFGEISNCAVNGLTFIQAKNKTDSSTGLYGQYVKIGGIAPAINTGTISNCSVRDFEIIMSCKPVATNHSPHIGGIAGAVYAGSTVENCYGEVKATIASTKGSVATSMNIGGIAGTVATTTTGANKITNCGGNVDISTVKSITTSDRYNYNGDIIEGKSINITGDTGYLFAGGIVGTTGGQNAGTIEISNSFATGNIENDCQSGNYTSAIGGILGNNNSTGTTTIKNCFTSTSVSGGMGESIGGMVGLSSTSLTFTANYFMGSVLDPYDGSVIGYYKNAGNNCITDGKDNKVYTEYAPTTTAGDGTDPIATTKLSTIPSLNGDIISSTNWGNINSGVQKYLTDAYAVATEKPITLTSGNNEHVFSVLPSTSRTTSANTTSKDFTISSGSIADILEGKDYKEGAFTTTKNDISAIRKFRFVKRLTGHNTENGTTDYPYTISNATDLVNMQVAVAAGAGFLGAQYKLTADISHGITKPIGMSQLMSGNTQRCADEGDLPFCGVVDGNNKTVSITSNSSTALYNGLFGVTNWSTIKDLNIKYPSVTTISNGNGGATGGLIGYALGSSLKNVVVSATKGITKNSVDFGGIIGISEGSEITKSHFNGEIKGTSRVGGLVGKSISPKTYTLLSGLKWGNIIATGSGGNTYNPQTIGFTASSDNITDCYVSGNVSSSETTNNTQTATGGLIGYLEAGNSAVKSSYMFGNVKGEKYVGGIVGELSNGNVSSITQSYTRGDISGVDYVGGMVGYIDTIAKNSSTINNSYYVGQITCNGILGAASGSYCETSYFFYDKQIAGNIPTCGASTDTSTGKSSEDLKKTGISGFNSAKEISATLEQKSCTDKTFFTFSASGGSEGTTTTLPTAVTTGINATNSSNSISDACYGSSRTQHKIDNTSSASYVSETFSFTGTAFDFISFVGNTTTVYTVTIDGVTISLNGGTKISDLGDISGMSGYQGNGIYTKKISIEGNEATAYAIRPDSNDYDYTAYINKPNSNLSNFYGKTFGIQGLRNGTHEVSVKWTYSKRGTTALVYGSYVGIEYYSPGQQSEGVDSNHYPRLTSFYDRDTDTYTKMTDLSTMPTCVFSDGNTSNGAYAFSPSKTLTILNNTSKGVTTPIDDVVKADGTKSDNINDLSGLTIEEKTGETVITNNSAAGKFTVNETYTADELDGYNLVIDTVVNCIPFYGEGTKDNPYSIFNTTVLNQFRDYINNVSDGQGQYFALTMGDKTLLDLAQVPDSERTDQLGDGNGSYVYDLTNLTDVSWANSVIGTKNHPFKGYFEGNNRIISNLNISNTATTSSTADEYYGLFGRVVQGTIANITVEGSMDVTYPVGSSTRNTYMGLVVARGESSILTNVTARAQSKSITDGKTLSYESGNSKAYTYNDQKVGVSIKFGTYGTYTDRIAASIGGIIGLAERDTTITDTVSNIKEITWQEYSNSSNENVYKKIGGIVGEAKAGQSENFKISNSVFYGQLSRKFELGSSQLNTNNYLQQNAVGGIVGNLALTNASSEASIKKCASYGSASIMTGYVGGILGSTLTSVNNSVFTLSNSFSSMDLYSGDKTLTKTFNKKLRLGGIIGTAGSSTETIENNTYAGMLHSENNKYNTRAGGIGGEIDVDIETSTNVFDRNKNPDVGYKPDVTDIDVCSKKTYELVESDGLFDSVIDETNDFGGTLAKEEVGLIIDAQSIPTYEVRTNAVIYDKNDVLPNLYPALSSVYALGDGATMKIVSNSDESNPNVMLTKSSRRVVSNKTDMDEQVLTRVVKMNGDIDELKGYGKEVRYLPSIEITGNKDTSFVIADLDNGDGINGDEKSFTIYNEDQLMGLATIMKAQTATDDIIDGFGGPTITKEDIAANKTKYSLEGMTVHLKNDLDFNDYTPISTKEHKDTVIGTGDTPFKGTFDGENHIISNYTITKTKDDAGTDTNEYIALFASADGATFKNLGLADINIARTGSTAGQKVIMGSLVASGKDLTISNVFSSADVSIANVTTATLDIGGFIGTSIGTNKIEKSYFTGSVGPSKILSNASADAPTAYNQGGFIGYSEGSLELKNSYVASYVGIPTLETANDESTPNATSRYGAFVGYSSSLTTTITGSYYDESVAADSMVVVGGRTLAIATYSKTTSGLKTAMSSDYNVGTTTYPTLKSFDETGEKVITSVIPVTFEASAASMSNASITYTNSTLVKTLDGSVIDINAELSDVYSSPSTTSIKRDLNGYAAVLIKYGNTVRKVQMYLRCWFDDAKNGVYTINTLSEWEEFVKLVNGDLDSIGHGHSNTNYSFDGQTVQLGKDITVNSDLTGELTYISMLDKGTNTFKGTFDGNGHSFVNIALKNNEADSTYVGLFNNIDAGATVKNISIAGTTTIEVKNSTAGTVYVGTVSGTNSGTITESYNASTVKIVSDGSSKVAFGGIVGDNKDTVSKCYNMGFIEGVVDGDELGGIAGKNSGTITQSYNTGIISGYKDKNNASFECNSIIGGIAAKSTGTVSECYNAAVLENYKTVSPIANGGTVSKSFVDGQVFHKDYAPEDGNTLATGITVKKTSSLSNGSLPSGFTSSEWTIVDGYYPMLKSLVSDDLTEDMTVSSYISAMVTNTKYTSGTDIATYDNFDEIDIAKLTSDIKASCEYDLATNQGTFNKTESDTGIVLTPNKHGTAYINLKANSSSDKQFIRICVFTGEETYNLNYKFDFSQLVNDSTQVTKKAPEYPGENTFSYDDSSNVITAKGSGTSGDPYIITTNADLTNFVKYVNDADTHGGRGRVFRLDNNITWSGTWTPIGNGTSPFNGTFIGDGHSISGITTIKADCTYNGIFGYIGSQGTVKMLAATGNTFEANMSNTFYIGAIAGRCDGTISNCYTTSEVVINGSVTSRKIYAGGIVGAIDADGYLIASYARPAGQGEATSSSSTRDAHAILESHVRTSGSALNTGDQSNFDPNYYAGVIAGQNKGTINGCYNTAQYQIPVGDTGSNPHASYGLIVGDNNGGKITNTHYANQFSENVYVTYTRNSAGEVTNYVRTKDENDTYGWTLTDFKKTESAGVTKGIANDSAAEYLSENLYLGTYEMTRMTNCLGLASTNDNNGFPILGAFDLARYTFSSFTESNLILNLQNRDASSVKVMNSLCDYTMFDFPKYDSILARQFMYVNLLSLPTKITYNISSVAYGYTLDNNKRTEIKWTTVNGKYTSYTDKNLKDSSGNGMQNNVDGTGAYNIPTLNSGTTTIMPTNTEKLYIYITLLPKTTSKYDATWGVHDSWDTATLKPYGDEVEE